MHRTNVPIVYAGELYDRTWRLYSGEISPEGIDLTYLAGSIEDVFWRQGRFQQFDAAEYSLASYLATLEDPQRPLVAIPVFPSRAFRHAAIYVNTSSGIEHPADLDGRTVGTPEWAMTAPLWIRGILSDLHDVDLRSIEWRTGGVEEPGREEKVGPPSGGFAIRPIPSSDTLSACLLDGRIDALIAARAPRAFLEGDSRIRRLFEDYRQAELEYFEATRIVPIMHVVVVRRELLEKHPWLGSNLYAAFEAARGAVARRLLDTAVCTSSLVWESAYAEHERSVLGDPFANGVEPNSVALGTILRYAAEQGITSKELRVDEVFAPGTTSQARV